LFILFCLIFVSFDQNGTLPQTQDVLKEILYIIIKKKKSVIIGNVYMCVFHY